MTDDAADADRRQLMAELRQQRRRVAAILAAEVAREGQTPKRALAAADDAGRRQFWERRFRALSSATAAQPPGEPHAR